MGKVLTVGLIALALVAMVSSAQANLIVNGSFGADRLPAVYNPS